MTLMTQILGERSLDSFLFDLETFQQNETLTDTITKYLDGDYKAILRNSTSQNLYEILNQIITLSHEQQDAALLNANLDGIENVVLIFITGLAAFNAFLQANVTGPPLDLRDVFTAKETTELLRDQCLKSLDVDGVSVYQHIPHVELFSLSRLVFTVYFPRLINNNIKDSRWMRIRINNYHQRLLSGLSGGRLSDSTALQDAIEKDFLELESEILGGESTYSTEAKVQFLLEKAQIYIMQGLDLKARENVKIAKTVSGFSYALSGALGKRTKFQQSDISQLVVFAKSKDSTSQDPITGNSDVAMKNSQLRNGNAPEALDLNDDTLLESIAFKKSEPEAVDNSSLPTELIGLQPDAQPQLQPLDQIILLTEATLKDSLSPLDKLNSEEILPYAVRVLTDKLTNWQIYTQALLVRSRIEAHRSRTQERSVLQLQVIVDQIIADTQEETPSSSSTVPEIRITSFLPAAKPSESAPVTERLRYIYPLNTPTRWELETELAYAWAGAGSLVSALEIFKRLELWAEVALCYHSVGQESKARQIVRRQLYYSSSGPEKDAYSSDAPEIANENWDGEIRPTPAHAPRLWCILGDLDQEPSYWQRAWEISGKRFARAQRTLGEYYMKEGNLPAAREAYVAATIVNRQNNETWSRLGDIDLAVGNWDGAVIAFQQSIMIDDTDAKTYSNLGSALLSKHAEMLTLEKAAAKDLLAVQEDEDDEDDELVTNKDTKGTTPQEILRQALLAYKRGASLAHSNWKIWDNVLTIALRSSPPSYPDLLLGLRAIIALRSPSIGEDAVDIDVLGVLIQEVISRDRAPGHEDEDEKGVYMPPRGSLARATVLLMEEITPLVTKRFALFHLAEKLSLYRKDYVSALSYAEKAWRMSQGEGWLEDGERWREVVAATDHLVSAYESYGPMEKKGGGEVEGAWRGKARSAVRGLWGGRERFGRVPGSGMFWYAG
ncbi:TPR repeat-containing [Hyphodiscus hymeniophilus]|uniref:TPR repeat-containing n=1 Tax=Hyphodiscus hymeniophilus TaxID=353542 RepID=A0A9P6VT27_9HELO|nr:TPR repeat-containing [Hyphodiscus hymeniophilus]